PAQSILHVGDDALADVEGARACGLRTVWMNRTGAAWAAPYAPADHEIVDLGGLVTLVEKLRSA
ncbi:MAG: HAD hydrolase-like protein, partial [Proteobacteria bacterium]|nr:HAD hydrolase-like protein [Pseudomonadota bacterium]